MRLIDADALLNDMSGCCNRSQFGRSTAKMCVRRAPTIDAEPVIRCRDCFHFKPSGECNNTGSSVTPDDFCSYGKRNEVTNAEI